MTGIFFGSTTGTTESVAARIAERLGVAQADVHNVAAASVEDVKKYDLLLLGSSTWGSGELQDDWPGFLDKLGKEDLSGRRVALFGCGDAGIYSDTFCDAMAEIRDGLASTGCTFVGGFDAEEYPVCSVYQIQYNVSIYINLILRPNLPTKSRSGGLLFFDYFRFIQILNSPDLNFTIRAKARVSHSKIFLPWFSLSNFFCRQSDAADTHIL